MITMFAKIHMAKTGIQRVAVTGKTYKEITEKLDRYTLQLTKDTEHNYLVNYKIIPIDHII